MCGIVRSRYVLSSCLLLAWSAESFLPSVSTGKSLMVSHVSNPAYSLSDNVKATNPVGLKTYLLTTHGSRTDVAMVAENAQPKYIIVGGGTAGCVLANRLTADKDNSVLLLEAGSPNFQARDINVPVGLLRLFKSGFDWGFQSRDEKYVTGDGIYLCRGKVLGGSSCTNAMLYHRGTESDYDSWGVEGWGAKDVLPYFTKAESNRSKAKGKYHGKGGLMEVEDVRYMNPLTKTFFKSCEQAGLEENGDFNDWSHSQEGFGRFQVAQKRGKRSSTASSYLKKAYSRKNLSVHTGAQITKVLIEDGKATGVEYVEDGEKRIAKVAPGGEVLLAGGAINSPQVLMLSGVGPADHLKSKDIEVKCDLPGVGENMQDHPAVTVMADITKPVSITDELLTEGSGKLKKLVGLKWLLTGTGPLASSGCDNGAFCKSSDDKTMPDLQLRFVPGRSDDPDGVKAYTKIGREGRPPSGVTIQIIGVRPQSSGTVKLKSSDPFDKPDIVTNYLENSADMDTLKKGISMARNLLGQAAFDGTVSKEVFPGADVSEVEDYIKSTVHSANAIVGTCKMGDPSDKMTVVDSSLKVKGVSGLRVIDSSVMPIIPGGQTAAPTVMIAEKAADMLLTGST